jgi:hypothetical protein
MLLPDKHIRICESILGLGALVLGRLDCSASFDQLMTALTPIFETPEWPAFHTAETVSLALCLLNAVGLVEVSPNGDVVRCD